MNPLQALQMLDNILKAVSLNRADHDNVRQAVAVIATALQPEEVTDPPE